MTKNRNVFDIADSSLILTADNIRLVNETIYNSETIEEKEQLVNEIYLSVLGQEQTAFSQDTIGQLEFIAAQCPLAGGNAVFRARSELSRYGIVSYYDDKYNCARLGYSRQMQPQNYGIKNKSLNDIIYPNPVDNILYLFSNESISDVEFTIFDAVGRQVYKSKVSFINGKTELDISSLAPGIYSIVSTDSFTFGFRSKFTVVR